MGEGQDRPVITIETDHLLGAGEGTGGATVAARREERLLDRAGWAQGRGDRRPGEAPAQQITTLQTDSHVFPLENERKMTSGPVAALDFG